MPQREAVVGMVPRIEGVPHIEGMVLGILDTVFAQVGKHSPQTPVAVVGQHSLAGERWQAGMPAAVPRLPGERNPGSGRLRR